MRIKSDFKDYYDCLQANDLEKDTIYVRKSEQIQIRLKDIPWGQCFDIVIGFCGKLYPAIQSVVVTQKDISDFRKGIPNAWVESCNGVKPGHYEYIYDHNFLRQKIQSTYSKWYFLGGGTNPLDVTQDKEVAKIWTDKYGPIFILRKNLVDKNDRLNQYNFQKILPPAAAYSELQRWVYNQAVPQKPIPEMSNAVKIEQKGFDLTTSFRGSQGPKRKRKNK